MKLFIDLRAQLRPYHNSLRLDCGIEGEKLFLTLLKDLFKIGGTLQKWKTPFWGSSTLGKSFKFQVKFCQGFKALSNTMTKLEKFNMFKVRNSFEAIPRVDGPHIQEGPQEELLFLENAFSVGP